MSGARGPTNPPADNPLVIWLQSSDGRAIKNTLQDPPEPLIEFLDSKYKTPEAAIADYETACRWQKVAPQQYAILLRFTKAREKRQREEAERGREEAEKQREGEKRLREEAEKQREEAERREREERRRRAESERLTAYFQLFACASSATSALNELEGPRQWLIRPGKVTDFVKQAPNGEELWKKIGKNVRRLPQFSIDNFDRSRHHDAMARSLASFLNDTAAAIKLPEVQLFVDGNRREPGQVYPDAWAMLKPADFDPELVEESSSLRDDDDDDDDDDDNELSSEALDALNNDTTLEEEERRRREEQADPDYIPEDSDSDSDSDSGIDTAVPSQGFLVSKKPPTWAATLLCYEMAKTQRAAEAQLRLLKLLDLCKKMGISRPMLHGATVKCASPKGNHKLIVYFLLRENEFKNWIYGTSDPRVIAKLFAWQLKATREMMGLVAGAGPQPLPFLHRDVDWEFLVQERDSTTVHKLVVEEVITNNRARLTAVAIDQATKERVFVKIENQTGPWAQQVPTEASLLPKAHRILQAGLLPASRLLNRGSKNGVQEEDKENVSCGNAPFRPSQKQLQNSTSLLKLVVPKLLYTGTRQGIDPTEELVLVTTFFPGSPLSSLCSRRSKEAAIQVTETLISAVKQLHAEGVFHLDLAPRNIMFDSSSNTLALVDFGVGKFLTQGGNSEILSWKDYADIIAILLRLLRGRTNLPWDGRKIEPFHFLRKASVDEKKQLFSLLPDQMKPFCRTVVQKVQQFILLEKKDFEPREQHRIPSSSLPSSRP